MAKKITPNQILRVVRLAGFNKRSWVYLAVLVAMLFFYAFSYYKPSENNNQKTSAESLTGDEARVIKVVDGDTIEVGNGPTKTTIRYIGVDTPETVKPNTPVQCFGKEASNKNKELVQDKVVVLKKDVQDKDKYGRTLRYVYLKNEDGTTTFINKLLVEEGYASAASFPPNVAHQEEFRSAEQKAREEKKGLWGSCR